MKDEYLNHRDFIESLKNPSLDLYHKVYHKNEGRRKRRMKKTTLSQRMDKLEVTVDKLVVTVTQLAEEMRDGFKQVNTRIDNLTSDVNSLKQEVKVINARLDYNNLKKLPNHN